MNRPARTWRARSYKPKPYVLADDEALLKHPITPDGRYFVVRGRLWRCSNPKLSERQREKLVKDLMLARRTKNRAGVDKTKRALGERGKTWWKGRDYNRYLAKNTPYAEWWNEYLAAH